MKPLVILAAGLIFSGWLSGALADHWKDESGKGRGRGDYERYGYGNSWVESERKLKFRTPDGCEIERKWKKGEYEEKIKCKRK
jgi:hypothetical protein